MMTSFSKFAFRCLLIGLVIFQIPSVSLADDSSKKGNVSLEFNGNPAPGSMGLDYNYRFSKNVRFTLGGSYYNDKVLANTAVGGVNLLLRPLLFVICDLFYWMFSGGSGLIYSHFLGNVNYLSPDKTGSAFGGGFDYLATPVIGLTPYIGGHVSYYQTAGSTPAFSSTFSGINPYIATGLEFGGIGLGYNLCPMLNWGSCGWLFRANFKF